MFEKKRGTRFLASVMALVMLLSLAPVGALAAKGSNDNESYDTQDTFNIEGVETYYPLSGESNSGFTEARYIWENGGSVYLAFTVNYGNNGNGGKPILTATVPNDKTLEVGTTLYTNLQFGDNKKFPAAGKKANTLWQIATYTGSIQDLLNDDNQLIISTQNQGGGHELENATYTVKEYPTQKPDPKPDPEPNSTDVYVYFQTQNTKGEPVDISGTSIKYNDHSWATLGKISTTQTLTSGETYTGKDNPILKAVGAQAKDNLKDGSLYNGNASIAPTVLEHIQWTKLEQYNGADNYVKAGTTCWHLDGQITGYKVTYATGADEGAVDGMPAASETYYLSGSGYTVSDATPTRDGCTFAGWKSSNSNDNTVYTAGSTMTMPGEDVTLTAVWEQKETPGTPTKPTKAVDAKYFVLLPGTGTPASGEDQGTSYYLPNETNNGGITGLSYLTGYTGGGLTAAGQAAANGSYTNIDSMNGVFNRTGIDASYLVVPTDLGYFTVGNWTAEGVYSPTSTPKVALSNVLGENFNTKNISIIWYSLKKQFRDGSVVYHVDGYVKDMPVTLTYHDNFTGSSESYTQNGLKSGETASIAQNGTVGGSKTFSHEGYEFGGWYDNAACTGTNYAGQTHTMMDNLELYAKWTPKQYTYTVEYYYDGAKNDSKTENGSAAFGSQVTNYNDKNITGYTLAKTEGLPLTISAVATKNVIKVYYTKTENPPAAAQYTVKHYKWDTQKKNYTFDSEETINSTVGAEVTATAKKYGDGYILNEQKSKQTKSGTVRKDNTLTLELYYDIDKIGSGNNKDQPDKIPDRYQVTINYVSSNTNWGSVNRSKEVITLINTESGEWLKTGTVIVPSCTATSAGGKCYFVNWTKKQEGSTTSSTVTSSANLTAQTIKNAKGGDVYTFTANFDRSSGGGSGGSNRPKPPVVEIPDDVPTGLNGKDHYAYIIGYGNNDVRPQNNITRAEVATIFFRLLTDETREANMTKSNGYNDMKDGAWYTCAVSTLSKMGIIKGYEDGSFKPDASISRAEFAAIAARFDPDGDKTPATFSDVSSHWAKDEISIAANHGWIKGYEDGSFKPDQKITRAETMTLVNRVLNRLPETKDDLHKDMKTWVDNMDETAWYYLAVQEATNSHYFKNKTSTKFEQWTDLRDTRDWSELEK